MGNTNSVQAGRPTGREVGGISPKQLLALRRYNEAGEAPDYGEFGGPGSLAWLNRERVTTALIRKGLLDADQRVTDAGLAVLAAAEARSNG